MSSLSYQQKSPPKTYRHMQSSRSVSLVLLLLWKQPDLKAAQSVVTGTEHSTSWCICPHNSKRQQARDCCNSCLGVGKTRGIEGKTTGKESLSSWCLWIPSVPYNTTLSYESYQHPIAAPCSSFPTKCAQSSCSSTAQQSWKADRRQ